MRNIEIKINEPCHENWDTMTSKAQGKFCASCATDVVDFTNMTDDQVKSYFTNYSGSVCGRFNTSQLDSNVKATYFSLSDCTKRFVRAFAMVFIMFASFEMQAQNYAIVKGRVATFQWKASVTVKGIIYGNNGEGISDAQVQLYKNGSRIYDNTTDNNGAYIFSVEQGNYNLRILKMGYEFFNTDVTISSSETLGDFELKRKYKQEDPQIMGMIKMGKPAIIRKSE